MEDDEVDAHSANERAFDTVCDQNREHALQRIRAFRKTLPLDWKFDRDETNSRESARLPG
jgi:antitoxin MazE